MLKSFILIIALACSLNAEVTLERTYYLDSRDIYLSDIIKDIKVTDDKKVFIIDKSRYTKRIKSRNLLKFLQTNGYTNFTSDYKFITFIKKSPIDLSIIKKSIEDYYTRHYKQINIKSIIVTSSGYIKSLPKYYDVIIDDKNYLSRKNYLYIKTPNNKKIFFSYIILADIPIFITKMKIKRGSKLTSINSKKTTITLDRFRAKPIQRLDKTNIQAKLQIKKNKIITTRDTEELRLVKRNQRVNVYLKSQNMIINFEAKALEKGRLNDTITIKKKNFKRLKARVVGKNKVEIEAVK